MSLVESSREPLRPVVEDDKAFERVLDTVAEAKGPVAFDVERAHGYRYWPRAYLFQLRRREAGTWLIDPTRFDQQRLSQLVEAAGDAEWVIHAATQDLPSMHEAGIVPPSIFDTELAARLITKPGVSLGALLSSELGIQLRKAHSAVNWATRPLKQSWLTYAALDVDYLLELRDTIDEQLSELKRREWAEQEFDWELKEYAREPVPRPEPWRRLSRITQIRHAPALALARELWLERDAIAQRRDRPPGHILPDAAIVELAVRTGQGPWPTRDDLHAVDGFAKPPGARYTSNWLAAIDRVRNMSPKKYPSKRGPSNGPPNPRNWDRVNPEAAERWALARPAVDELACDIGLQPSLLAPPAALQEVLWRKQRPTEEDLLAAGMRPWQAEILSGLMASIFE